MRKFITVVFAFTVFGCGDDSSQKGKIGDNGKTGSTQNPESGSCADVFTCTETCETESCIESCKTQEGPIVARNFDALMDCVGGCESDTDCIASVCDAELRACGYDDDGSGGGGGGQEGTEYDVCEENGFYGDGECDLFCAKPDIDCVDDGGGGGGSPYGCGHALDCTLGCEVDSCYEGCLTPLDQNGMTLLRELLDCFGICETDDCVAFCSNELEACIADD